MDRAETMLRCALAFAVPFVAAGFLFGGLARLLAQKWQRTSERTRSGAFSSGALRRAICCAVVGMLLGGLAGYMQAPDPAGVRLTAEFFILLVFVWLLAAILGCHGLFLGVVRGFEKDEESGRTGRGTRRD